MLLISSRSALSFVAVPAALAAMIYFSKISNPAARLLTAFAGLMFLVAFVYAGPLDLLVECLAGLLGRDPTLSHRTEIWNAVLTINRDYWLLGRGYGVPWNSGIGDYLALLIGTDVGNP